MITVAQLKKFCSTDKRRVDLLTPFSRGGDTYATDGALLLRVPKIASIAYDPWKNRISLEAEQLFSRMPVIKPSALIPLPDLPIRPEYRERRRWWTPPSLIIGGRRLCLEYLWQIATLRRVRLAPDLTGPKDPMQFVFEGGDGLIMPMAPNAIFATGSIIHGELSASEKMFLELSKGSLPSAHGSERSDIAWD